MFYWKICKLFSVCNFIKNKTPAQVFFASFEKFSGLQVKNIKNETRHILKILKIFLEQLFGEHLRRVASTDVIIARFSCKIYLFIKIENNIKDNCFYVYVSFYLLIFLISLNTAIILLETLVFFLKKQWFWKTRRVSHISWNSILYIQKQPSEVFCKKRCS